MTKRRVTIYTRSPTGATTVSRSTEAQPVGIPCNMARITQLPQLSSDDEDVLSKNVPFDRSRATSSAAVVGRPDTDVDDEIEDFTSGREVVRKVLREISPTKKGQVTYQVEFEDYHVEEVSKYLFVFGKPMAPFRFQPPLTSLSVPQFILRSLRLRCRPLTSYAVDRSEG